MAYKHGSGVKREIRGISDYKKDNFAHILYDIKILYSLLAYP